MGGSLTVELARRDLERESSERYKGFVVKSGLKRVLNEAVKTNATASEEEVRRFPDRKNPGWARAAIESRDA